MRERKTNEAKTEPPTQKRLRDLRRKGHVARSADVPATVAVVGGVCFLLLAGEHMFERLNRILERAAGADFRALDDAHALVQWTSQMLLEVFWLTAPIALGLSVLAALAGFLQVGPVFSGEQVKPQLSRIDPIAGAKRVFSTRTLVDLLKLVLKAAVLAAIVWFTTRNALPTLLQSHLLSVSGILPLALRLIAILCWYAVACFVAIAAFDLWFQKWQFFRRNRMSVQEVRRENKEIEGDPHIRRRRRQLHRETAEAGMLMDVRKASVVVVNPTHIAVALYYQEGETDLPVVVAKGEGDLARAIRRVAEEEGIPIVHDVDLARRLRADAPVDQYIPEELIEPVAAVLRWARDLGRP